MGKRRDGRILLVDIGSGVQASGVAWLSTPVTIQYNGTLNLQISTQTAFTLQYTLDGSNYANGVTFAANDGKDLTLTVKKGDTLNLKQTSGGNVTLNWARVQGP